MILDKPQLKSYRGKVTMVDGGFDPLHIGHVKYFEEAAKLGLPLFCNVRHDGYINGVKARPAVLPQEQRIALINSLKPVSYVYLSEESTADVLEELRPAKYVKGADWKQRGLPEKEKAICAKHGIEIVYLDTNLDSSTNIYGNFVSAIAAGTTKESVNNFEQLLFSQKEVKSDYYDDHYFKGNWREGDNDYSIEKRRAIEAKNPQNIKDTFLPKNVLDVGCGPGALMFFLYELGINAYGIDFSRAAKQMAPKEIRENIVVAPVTEYHDFGREFDLVICRELLEHLTIFQVRQVIKALALYTSKYLYVTTRFCRVKKSILDACDDKETDASHITLLTKDFAKVLFMLEGLKPRPDLEAKMDWKNFGRVFVFEKIKV